MAWVEKHKGQIGPWVKEFEGQVQRKRLIGEDASQ